MLPSSPKDAAAREFRSSLLDLIDPDVQPIPTRPFTAFVWPTELCSIGCAHCSFGSIRVGGESKRVLARHPEVVAQWLSKAGARKLVVCGGGEPLDEPEFVIATIAACGQLRLRFEVYTSGVSLLRPKPVAEYIQEWSDAWSSRVSKNDRIGVRLSVDLFHEERLGLDPIVEWIQSVEARVPDWFLSIRGIRVEGDGSVERLAARLAAGIQPIREGTAWLTLRSGRRILVEWKGFVFEERGRLSLLRRRGLRLNASDSAIVNELTPESGTRSALGRPLSARLTVTERRLDLEIHADGAVHVLESSPPDRRLNLFENTWEAMRATYYRDPILHRVVEAGLPAVASLISAAQRARIPTGLTVPYSVDRLQDHRTLAWVTAAALLANSQRFIYPDDARRLSRQYLESA